MAPAQQPPAHDPSVQQALDAGGPRLPRPAGNRVGRRGWLLALLAVAVVTAAWALLRFPESPRADDDAATARERTLSIPVFPAAAAGAAAAERTPPIADPGSVNGDGADAADLHGLLEVDSAPLRRPAVTDFAMPPGSAEGGAAAPLSLQQRRSLPSAAPQHPVEQEDAAVRLWNESARRSVEALSAAAAPASSAGTAPLPPPRRAQARHLVAADSVLLRGTYIRCVLNNRIITDVPGHAACTVTEPVYSSTGRRLLLPEGTRVLGAYGPGDLQYGRLAMVWDRMVTPQGVDVELDTPGVDDMGSAGHPGRYTAHWGSRIASALFISLLSDGFKYAAETHGPAQDTLYPQSGVVVRQPFQSNTARSIEALAGTAVQAAQVRPPTLTLQAGARLTIRVSADVDFSAVGAP